MSTRLLLLTFCCLSIFKGRAQPYAFTQSSSSYSLLTSPSLVSSASPWTSSSTFTVPLGFTFTYMGTDFTSLYVKGDGTACFDALGYYVLHPFGVALVDKGTSSSLSPISYKVTGVSPNKIIKIEWKNTGFEGQPSSTAHFQLWLYQTTHKIEFHYGTISVVTPSLAYQGRSGASIGIKKLSSASWCDYGRALVGTVPAEECIDHSGTYSAYDFCLTGTPASGTVYEFIPGISSLTEETSPLFRVYPNPASTTLHVDGHEIFAMEFIDVNGCCVLSSTGPSVDLTSLAKGVYVLRINQVVQQKVIVH